MFHLTPLPYQLYTQVKYSEEISESLKDSDFHLVYVFPGLVPDESVDINLLVQNLAKQTFTDYVFIIGKRWGIYMYHCMHQIEAALIAVVKWLWTAYLNTHNNTVW